MVDKLIRDGKVAVIISPGYGAGWSTWVGGNSEAAVFCPEIAEAIESRGDVIAVAERLFPDEYTNGLANAVVIWLDEGTPFMVKEYDGYESLHTSFDLPYTA